MQTVFQAQMQKEVMKKYWRFNGTFKTVKLSELLNHKRYKNVYVFFLVFA